MKQWKKLLSFALVVAMIAGVAVNNLDYLKAEAADRPAATGIPGDANGDGKLSVSDLVRIVVEQSDGSRLSSVDGLFDNGSGATAKDTAEVRRRLLYKTTGTVAVNVTGVDSDPTITIARENGVKVYQGTGSFSTVLPVGKYVVTAESDTAVAKTERFVLDGDNAASVNVKIMPKLEAATYKLPWESNTAEFVFEPDNGIYRGAWAQYNTSVLKMPAAVTAEDEWMLEADVQIWSDWNYPSVGFALYNGGNFEQNAKFEIVRTTPEPYGDYSNHQWLIRVPGMTYWPKSEEGSNDIERWLAENQEVLKGKVRMTLLHTGGEYHLLVNGITVCAITGDAAANLTSGWESVRLGFYAEQEATFENWSYSTDVSKYITEWIHEPFEYNPATGSYLVTDHNKTANGGYLAGISVQEGEKFLFETTVRDMDQEQYPSIGIIVGTGRDQYARFSFIRGTDDNQGRYAIRVGSAEDKQIAEWHDNIEALGVEGGRDIRLSLMYEAGIYRMYVNGNKVLEVGEDSTYANSEITIKASLGEGNKKVGLFAERKATFVDWEYSTDISSYSFAD